MRILYLCIILIIFTIPSLLKGNETGNELIIDNESGEPIYIKLYPSSALFNCLDFTSNLNTEYSLYIGRALGGNRNGDGPDLISIVGLDGYALINDTPRFYDGYFEIIDGNTCQFSVDGSISRSQDGIIGFGIYTLEIYKYVDSDFSAAVGVPKSLQKR